jgi:hypothetical protein
LLLIVHRQAIGLLSESSLPTFGDVSYEAAKKIWFLTMSVGEQQHGSERAIVENLRRRTQPQPLLERLLLV